MYFYLNFSFLMAYNLPLITRILKPLFAVIASKVNIYFVQNAFNPLKEFILVFSWF